MYTTQLITFSSAKGDGRASERWVSMMLGTHTGLVDVAVDYGQDPLAQLHAQSSNAQSRWEFDATRSMYRTPAEPTSAGVLKVKMRCSLVVTLYACEKKRFLLMPAARKGMISLRVRASVTKQGCARRPTVPGRPRARP